MTGKQLSPKLKVERTERVIELVERDGLNFATIGIRLRIHENFARTIYKKAREDNDCL